MRVWNFKQPLNPKNSKTTLFTSTYYVKVMLVNFTFSFRSIETCNGTKHHNTPFRQSKGFTMSTILVNKGSENTIDDTVVLITKQLVQQTSVQITLR